MSVILFIQILVSLLLSATILLQSRGTGLSTVWGGQGGSSFRTKRGAEKLLFSATIILAALFIILALISLLS